MKQIKFEKFILKKWVRYALLSIFLIVFSYSTFKIGMWILSTIKTNKLTTIIIEETPITEVSGTSTQNVGEPLEEESDYWKFIKQDFISVDFNNLKERNEDTVAWIYINNTNVNYPVLQTDNNELYLDHAFDRSYNDSGWLFMDYRNDAVNFGTNTIIYGHSMKNKTMFGSLLKARYKSWYTNTDNQVIKLSTPTENTLWQIFSIYAIAPESYYLMTDFGSDSQRQEFFTTMISRSKYNFNVSLTPKDKILTLSTCNTSNGDERFVVQAKLIKRMTR